MHGMPLDSHGETSLVILWYVTCIQTPPLFLWLCRSMLGGWRLNYLFTFITHRHTRISCVSVCSYFKMSMFFQHVCLFFSHIALRLSAYAHCVCCACVCMCVCVCVCTVDMTGQGCFDVEDRPIVDDQVYTVYADYKPTQQPTLDHCDVSIRATQPNRRLEYLVEKLTIFDCGIEIWVFDNPTILNNPTVC